MINAEEARKLKNNICELQLEQIERGIKESIIAGGTSVYYQTDALKPETISQLVRLGYKVRTKKINEWTTYDTEISWGEEDEDASE